MLQSGQGGQGMGSNSAQYGERIQQTLSGAGSALQQSAAKISGDNATSALQGPTCNAPACWKLIGHHEVHLLAWHRVTLPASFQQEW